MSPYRVSYERFCGVRHTVGSDVTAKANGWGNTFKNFKTKKAAKNYAKRFCSGMKPRIYHVKGRR